MRLVAIVDDDDAVRTAIAGLVRSFGYDARIFSSGPDFVHSEHRQSTGCVITDVQMAGMNGLELQRVLLAEALPPSMIFITAFPNDLVRSQALARGAVGFLVKPFEADDLARLIVVALAAAPRE